MVEDQREELIKAIAGCMGEYCLAEDFKEDSLSFTVVPDDNRAERVHQESAPNESREPGSQSVPLIECDLEDLPSAVVKDIGAHADVILEKYNIIQLENFTFCVMNSTKVTLSR